MSGLNIRFILKMLGALLAIETFFMLLSTGVAYFYGGYDAPYLLGCSLLTMLFSVIFIFIGLKVDSSRAGKREGAITVTFTWLLFSFFGMLPFYTSGAISSVTDAFFETMSGFTATGASVVENVEMLPKGLLFWRSITQWQGGMGMIVLTLAILPLFGGSAAQLFDAEATAMSRDKFLPRVTQVAKRLWFLYLGLTLLLAFLFWLGPMDIFDAVCHAFTTMATGGYSTKQQYLFYYNSPYVNYVASVFMIIGGINFALLYFLFKGNWRRFFSDEELRAFFIVIVVAFVVMFSGFLFSRKITDTMEALHMSVFQAASLTSSTCYGGMDYVSWGPFFCMLYLVFTLFCGCSGSTSGGIKMIRGVIAVKSVVNEFRKYTHSKAVLVVRLNKQPLPPEVVSKVIAFILLYLFLILGSCLVYSASGMEFMRSLGTSLACVNNTGSALTEKGISGSFADLPDFIKWYSAILMMVGRLEIFTVISILTPGFWK